MNIRSQSKRTGWLWMSLLVIIVLISSFGAVQAAPSATAQVQ